MVLGGIGACAVPEHFHCGTPCVCFLLGLAIYPYTILFLLFYLGSFFFFCSLSLLLTFFNFITVFVKNKETRFVLEFGILSVRLFCHLCCSVHTGKTCGGLSSFMSVFIARGRRVLVQKVT